MYDDFRCAPQIGRVLIVEEYKTQPSGKLYGCMISHESKAVVEIVCGNIVPGDAVKTSAAVLLCRICDVICNITMEFSNCANVYRYDA